MVVDNMKIAVLSGKGGTGKTLVSVNLSAAAKKANYIDCDVEEPNGHLFLKPQVTSKEEIKVSIPYVDNSLCNGCRKCVDFCKFNALAYIKNKVLLFNEVCHSCGGCKIVCPNKAIKDIEKVIGTIECGKSDDINVYSGFLNTGETSGIPIINSLLTKGDKNNLTIIDCPPGSACIVMESIKDADYCVLVAEPTIFGVHNLNMVYELVKIFNKPFGVVLNKCLEGYNPAEEFCKERNITILSKIPFDNKLGKINSSAEIAVYKDDNYKKIFTKLLDNIKKEVCHETTSNS